MQGKIFVRSIRIQKLVHELGKVMNLLIYIGIIFILTYSLLLLLLFYSHSRYVIKDVIM